MTIRKYQSRSQKTVLTNALAAGATTMTVNSGSTLAVSAIPNGQTYTVVIDPDTSLEEIVDITNWSSGNTFTIARGIDGSQDIEHSAGAEVRHMSIGRDHREANTHAENTTTAHGLTIANVTLSTGTGNVSTAMLASNAVTTAKITDANVTTAKIADSAITSAKIADLTIATGDIADSAITSAKIADLTIATGDIADAAITTAKIADGAVATVDIADLAVTTGKLADSSVTSAKIADGTIVNADVNTSAQIAYGKLNLTNTIVNADINASAAIALSKLATDPLARANHTGTQTASTISDFDTQVRTSRLDQMAAPTAAVSANSQKITNLATPTTGTDAATKDYADLMIPLTQKGAANGVASLGSDGKLTTAQIPDVTITDTSVVSSQAAMLALTAQVGDVAVRTDLNKSFILKTAGASTLANWQELLTPTDSVISVDGQTGAVDLSSTYATVANAANKLPLAGGTMSGAIAMGTNKITGLGDPTLAQDAATKNYIDTVVLAPSNLTGPITSVGNVTSIASQTGTGSKFVVDNTPTLITPVLGVATATSINGTTIPTSKTLVATDSTEYVVPSQTGNTGKYLTTDGTTSSWGTVATTAAATPTVAGTLYGQSSSTLADNLSVGYTALDSNTTGSYSTALGTGALTANTTGNFNTAIGNAALDSNTTGSFNTAISYGALGANATGLYNTAVGYQALSASTANFNTAVGYNALQASTASSTTAVGYNALSANTTGSGNTAVGNSALDVNTTGANNTALGNHALGAVTTNGNNTAVGSDALQANTAANNTAVGALALDASTTGSSNTALGANALGANTTGGSNTAVGNNTLLVANSTANTAVGNSALDSITTNSSFNSAFGSGALVDITSNSSNNTALGYNSGNTFSSGSNNTFVGVGTTPSTANVSNEITLGNTAVTRFRIPGIGFDINRDIELMNIMGAY